MIEQGTIIDGPDGQAYRMRESLFPGDALTVEKFDPMGGAPHPVVGELMPDWLAKALAEE